MASSAHDAGERKLQSPLQGMVVRGAELDAWLGRTHDPDPRVRVRAVGHLCPCHTRSNQERVWDRILEMANDPDAHVRSAVLHALGDGSPRSLEPRIVAVLEGLYHDADAKLRRRVRKLLAHHRRTGVLNIL